MSPVVRRVRPTDARDLAVVGDVCGRTGAAGGDARGPWSSDHLLPEVLAAGAGAPAVRPAMDPASTGARASHDRLGSHEIEAPGGGATHLGRATT